MRIPLYSNLSLLLGNKGKHAYTPSGAHPIDDNDQTTHLIPAAAHGHILEPKTTRAIKDPNLQNDISKEILDFFTDDNDHPIPQSQIPTPLQAQYSADIDALMEQIQLDVDEELLQYFCGETTPIDSKEIQIELLDPSPDDSGRLLQTRHLVLCALLDLDAAASVLTTPQISRTNILLRITSKAFKADEAKEQKYYLKLLQRLTS